ncbi:hypothetical protein HPB47_026021 [Ixodes persulcatus]|uniref:Uncharacterized protein n=1 Tax=Ixodes persulcatus TaxID=34615 RepID=A0AC60PZW6_IXOPE|nr:hypothetical protein HPB47_026021 [Ixodes persulcatus]
MDPMLKTRMMNEEAEARNVKRPKSAGLGPGSAHFPGPGPGSGLNKNVSGPTGPGRPGPCLAVMCLEAVKIEKIKVRARHFLDTQLKMSLLHKTATFLWPQFRQLRMLPDDEGLEVDAHVRDLLARVTEAITQDEDETKDDVRDPASKRRCLGWFQDWCDGEVDNLSTKESDEYPQGKKDYSCSRVSELCDFSKGHENVFPKLSLLSECIRASLLRVLAANGTLARPGPGRLGPGLEIPTRVALELKAILHLRLVWSYLSIPLSDV